MKKYIVILILSFKTFIVLTQTLQVQDETYLYSTPFYSWEKLGFSSPEKVLLLKKNDKVIALGFYLIGDKENYVGDVKVKFNETEGWISSINFNSNSLRKVPLLNNDADFIKLIQTKEAEVKAKEAEEAKIKETEKKAKEIEDVKIRETEIREKEATEVKAKEKEAKEIEAYAKEREILAKKN